MIIRPHFEFRDFCDLTLFQIWNNEIRPNDPWNIIICPDLMNLPFQHCQAWRLQRSRGRRKRWGKDSRKSENIWEDHVENNRLKWSSLYIIYIYRLYVLKWYFGETPMQGQLTSCYDRPNFGDPGRLVHGSMRYILYSVLEITMHVKHCIVHIFLQFAVLQNPIEWCIFQGVLVSLACTHP